MIAFLDVYYRDACANAAAIVCPTWTSDEPAAEYTAAAPHAPEYRPGKFYMRELEPLLAVIQKIKEPVETFVIDAYCHLSSDLAPGLGVYLHNAVPRQAAIVGVAKNR